MLTSKAARLAETGGAPTEPHIPHGCKQTEIGVIPGDWEVRKIGSLKPFVTSGSRGWAEFYSDRGSPFIRITNLSRNSIDLDLGDLRLVNVAKDDSEVARTELHDGDVLISITADIGIIGYVSAKVSKPAYINQHIALLRVDPEKTCSKFISYFLASEQPQKLFRALTDSGAKAGMNLTTVQQIRLALPTTKAEQEAIAEALSDADALIESLEQLIAKKRQVKQGAMQELLTGKKRLPGFIGRWKVQPIQDLEKARLVRLARGKVISKRDIDRVPGDFPIYSSSVKSDGVFGHYGEFMFDEEMITWSVDGGGDFFYRPKHKFSVTNVCGYMRVDSEKISYPFLAAHLQLLHSRLTFDYQVKAHPSVIRKAYEVSLPKLAEQTAIASIFSDIDADITALEEKLAKARMVKQGMMQELLTGRTRLV